MATAQTATGPGRDHPDKRFAAVSSMASHITPRENPHVRSASGHGSTDDFRGIKRRAEIDDDARRDELLGHPNYASSSYRSDNKPDSGTVPRLHQESIYSRGSAYDSARAHLPPINSLSSSAHVDEGLASKKRRAGAPYDYTESAARHPSQPSYGEDIEDDRYRASRPARTVSHSHNGQPSTDERGYRLPPPSGRIPSGQHSPPSQANEDLFRPPPQGPDDHYDQGTLLARRRGDAAQAKASKLHIDVGSAASDRSLESSAPPPLYHGHPRSSIDASLIARSAPPSKLSFSEREPPSAPSSDPRGGPPRGEPGFASSSPHYPPGIVHTQRGGPPSRMYPEGHNGAHGQTILRSPPHGRHTPISGGEPPCSSARLGPGGSGPPQLPPSSSTPLTSRFVPHTATLPSPAYHTTRMMQGPAGNSMLPQGSGPSVQAPPKTTNLTPGPPTARIPDHLRSPPSSKTQFLSLFSNFYDSLSDSRMLKATLEDQVRRSNALLQTLQKSSKVLEATVDRKIREERSVWESKVKHLEARIARLEGGEPVAQSNSSSPTQSGRRGSAQESVNGAEDARSGSVSPLSSGEAAREMREQTTRDSGDQTTEGQALGSDGGDREEHSDGGNK